MKESKISEKIKEIRKENDLTQSSLGFLLNVTRQAVSNWEVGKCMPDVHILLKISKLFNITINDLLTAEENNKSN